jgi:hypothetical protein
VYTNFSVRKSVRKRPLGRPRHKWEDNIKMDFKESVGFIWHGVGTSWRPL